MKTFRCNSCDEDLPVTSLSHQSLVQAGTPSYVEAAEILEPEDLICVRCEDLGLEALDLYEDAGHLGRTYQESWELSGVALSQGERVFRMLNY